MPPAYFTHCDEADGRPAPLSHGADVTMKELLALNHGIDPAKVEESQTILLPAGRLSARDREILQGAPRPRAPAPVRTAALHTCRPCQLACLGRRRQSF
jgi:hypothetical protein